MKLSQAAIAMQRTAEAPQKKPGLLVRTKGYVRTLFSGFGLRSDSVWATISGSHWGDGIGDAQRAMQLSAVWSAVRRYSETISSLPLKIFEWTDNGPIEVEDTQSQRLINESPNADQTPMEFWEGMQGSVELAGDAVAIKEKIGSRVVALRMVNPYPPYLEIFRNTAGSVVYRIAEKNLPPRDYGSEDILHIRGFSLGALRGISTVKMGASSLGLAYNAQQSAQQVYKNGLRVSGFITTPGSLTEQDRPRLKKILDDYMGGENAGGLMILEQGMEFQKMGINPIDAELLSTRKFEIEEIGRWFDMPPILLGHAGEGQTMWGTGVDAIIQGWLTLGLRQRLIRNQMAIGKRLLSTAERSRGYYARYNPDALLAVNSTTRIQVLKDSVQGSLLAPNEARALMDRGKVPGGDQVLAQVNLAPLDKLGENAGSSEQVRAMLQNWLVPNPGETHVKVDAQV